MITRKKNIERLFKQTHERPTRQVPVLVQMLFYGSPAVRRYALSLFTKTLTRFVKEEIDKNQNTCRKSFTLRLINEV